MASVRFAMAALVVGCFAVGALGYVFVRYEAWRIARRDAKRNAASSGGGAADARS